MWKKEGDLSRFDMDPEGIAVHTNKTLACRDCRYRLRAVGSCEQYPERKPEGVLDNTEPCPHYEKKRWPF